MSEQEIPVGLCQCGCGQPTTISPYTCVSMGYVKGRPRRFCNNHHRRLSPVEYVVDPETGCWNWSRHVRADGYGWGYDGVRQTLAHRVIWERLRGPLPEGTELDHLCRNRRCVNPDHLQPVSHLVNTRRGSNTKLSLDQVAEILRRYETDGPFALAREFGVSRSWVWKLHKHGGLPPTPKGRKRKSPVK